GVLGTLDDRAGADELAVGEDVAVDERPRLLAPVVRPGDAVVEQPTSWLEPVTQVAEVGGVVAYADVLGETDGGDRVEAGLEDVAVVEVAALGEIAEALAADGRLGPLGL